MKTRTTLTKLALLLALIFFLPIDILAQEKEKGGPPSWAPAHGYRAKTRHIYFPDHNFYFDIQKEVYIYISGNNWQVGVRLPSLFAGIDLKGAVRVELDLAIDSPQKHNADHMVKYKSKGKGIKVKAKSGNQGKRKGKRKN